jgi:hypothetical protein
MSDIFAGTDTEKVVYCEDMMCHVFRFLGSLEAVTMAVVCKDWKTFVANPACWKMISWPLSLNKRWRYSYNGLSPRQVNDLFARLVHFLDDKGCLSQVKLVRAYLTMDQAEVYQLLLKRCPSFASGNLLTTDSFRRFGISAPLINKYGPPHASDTLCISNDSFLEVPLPKTIRHLHISAFFDHDLIPEFLEILEVGNVWHLKNLKCALTLRKLVLNATGRTNRLVDMVPMPKLRTLVILAPITSRELANFATSYPDIESFTFRMGMGGHYGGSDGYIKQLKQWQLKTLSVTLDGNTADGGVIEHVDDIEAYILQELPSLEHFELLNERL